ncbi:MAG: adenylate kinase [Acidimicrobiia bacterium]|nr:adenylate kinase [Acidimicrobiia bacterium]
MSTRGPRLVLLGKQGAGKGTQATRLADHYKVAHLSTGDLFRDAANFGHELGLEAKSFMDRGELVPDETVVGLVAEHLGIDDRAARGFVLDGFPRTRRQAEELRRILDGRPLDLAIDLDVPTEIVLRRIAGRRVFAQCGALYHVENPPKENWTCDACGGRVVQRDDDTEEAVMRRLELYEVETLPVIQFYRRAATLAHVDGSEETDDVFKQLVETVEAQFDPTKP